MNTIKLEEIANFELLAGLVDGERETISAYLEEKHYSEGKVIFS